MKPRSCYHLRPIDFRIVSLSITPFLSLQMFVIQIRNCESGAKIRRQGQEKFARMMKTVTVKSRMLKLSLEVQEGDNTALLAIEGGVALLEDWL